MYKKTIAQQKHTRESMAKYRSTGTGVFRKTATQQERERKEKALASGQPQTSLVVAKVVVAVLFAVTCVVVMWALIKSS